MGDYSTVQLQIDSEHNNWLHEWCETNEFLWDNVTTSVRTPLGKHKHPNVYVWDEVRSGTENPDIQVLVSILIRKRIPYRLIDEGCWGAWPEEEEVFDGTHRRGRPRLDGEVVLRANTFMLGAKGKNLAEIGAMVVDYFSDDPSKKM